MWRVSDDIHLRSDVISVWLLDREPEWQRFWACCQRAVRRYPVLSCRAVEPRWGLGAAVWMPDPEFQLARHVHALRLAEPGTPRQLLNLLEWQECTGLERDRPPWQALLVGGYQQDKAALVIRHNHSLADGVSAVSVFTDLFGSPSEGRPAAQVPTAITRTTTASRRRYSRAVSQVVVDLGTVPRESGRLARSVSAGVRGALRRPGAAADRSLRLLRSLEQAGPPFRGSRLLRRRNTVPHYEVVPVPVTELKQAAKAVGVSVTALLLSLVLGAFADYHRHFRHDERSLTVAVPVNLQPVDRPRLGNHVGVLRLHGPLTDLSPAERARLVNQRLLRARANVVTELFPALSGIGSWIPGPLVRNATVALSHGIDLMASSFFGPPPASHVAGARVTGAMAFAPRGGIACNATMITMGEECAVCLNLDPAAFLDIALVIDLFEQQLARLPALAERTRAPGIG
ncbi:wax ester/triacylglycerol synthase domain-containing protein [Actinomadura macrotermitis]|nr:wax ester/triacylglycerol synthase domain-containing protein [Actinomadura macrotermitis]